MTFDYFPCQIIGDGARWICREHEARKQPLGEIGIGVSVGPSARGNQLVEAQRDQSLTRMLKRWASVELIAIDELGYVPLAEVDAELLFQVIAERAERQP